MEFHNTARDVVAKAPPPEEKSVLAIASWNALQLLMWYRLVWISLTC